MNREGGPMRKVFLVCLALAASAFGVERMVFGETFTNYT
jgi:hypothetical protein